MNSFVQKLSRVIIRADSERPFTFVALLHREGATDWDLVVAADWLKGGDLKSQQAISELVRESLNSDDLVDLGRIVIVSPRDKSLLAELQRYGPLLEKEPGRSFEIVDAMFSGLRIERGYVFVARTTSAVRRNMDRAIRVSA